MRLRLERQPPVGSLLRGELFVDDVYQCLTLENEHFKIPLGQYRVLLTVSERAAKGELWSPAPNHALMLVTGVPGRTGIRFHAGNTPADTVGCILVGEHEGDGSIGDSRPALTDLQAQVTQMLAVNEPVWLDVAEESPVANV